VDDLDEDLDMIDEDEINGEAFDDDFEMNEEGNGSSAKATTEKKRGRPKKTS